MNLPAPTTADPEDTRSRALTVTAMTTRPGFGRWGRRIARNLVEKRLSRIETGVLRVEDLTGDRSEPTVFGGEDCGSLQAEIQVMDARFWTLLVTGGALGAAEAFAEGWWRSPNLTEVIRLFARNRAVLSGIDGGFARWGAPLLRRLHEANRNTQEGARRNIEAHYDLSNDFFSLFLDRTMTYSCGIFATPTTTLEEAQLAKIDRLCSKLELRRGQRLLEIGTGWGALARHAAEHYGCEVVTTTISKEQHEWAARRIAEAGLEDRVTLLLEDYRALEGKYDRIVSVEMIEAVGADYFDEYFQALGSLLEPGGVAAIQAITIQDQDFLRASRHVDFIKRYIFPGSCIPSVTAMCASMTKASDLKLVHLEDFTPHYATTLDRWSRALTENAAEAKAMGLDDRFLNTWEYYFRYCEGGFEERHIGLVQMMLAKPGSEWQGVSV